MLMLKYQIYKSMLKDSPSYGKYYARIISDGTYDVKALAEHMSKHNSPFSPGTITGILTDAISCVKELALDGKRITLDGLVSIGLSITHKMGAATADEFSVSKNVDKVKLVAMGVGEFSSSILTTQAKLKESNTYQSPRTSTSTTSPDDGGETPENIYILILFFLERGSLWGLGYNHVEVSNLSVAVEGQSFIR